MGSGVEGNGLRVAVERALSVLELVIELKREFGSFLVIVTGRSAQHGLVDAAHRLADSSRQPGHLVITPTLLEDGQRERIRWFRSLPARVCRFSHSKFRGDGWKPDGQTVAIDVCGRR